MNKTTQFHHIRNVGRKGRDNLTVAYIKDTRTDKDGNEHKLIFVGISRCSRKDQFNKAKGRMIALGRAERARDNVNKGVFARIHRDSPYSDSFVAEVDSFVKKDIVKLISEDYLKSYLGKE